jgi:AbrB family looped-hinge helix DNA binding protein
MADLATTRLSSRGQVVIPEEIRRRLSLRPGTQFIVVADRDVVILKTISAPTLEGLDTLLAEARREARKARLRTSDVDAIVNRVRGRR